MILSENNLKNKDIISNNDNHFLVRYLLSNNSDNFPKNNNCNDILIEITPIYDENEIIKYLILQELSTEEKARIDSLENNLPISSRIKIIKDNYDLEVFIDDKILPLSIKKVVLAEKILITELDFPVVFSTAIYYCKKQLSLENLINSGVEDNL